MAIIFKLLFKLMGRVCCKKTWVSVLDVNFSNFLNRLREVLKDDLEIFCYLKSRFYSFIINLSLYSVFAHLCFCKRTCNKKSLTNITVIFVLEFMRKKLGSSTRTALTNATLQFSFCELGKKIEGSLRPTF